MITREQANILADLARTIRPAWDTRAIVAAIGEVQHRDPAEVAWALVRVAENPEMRTPKALTFEGDHWRRVTPSSPSHGRVVRDYSPTLTARGTDAIAQARTIAAAAAAKAKTEGVQE